MATKTLGSIGTTTLTAVQWPSPELGVPVSEADLATIAQSILDDRQGVDPLSGTYPAGAGGMKLADRIWPGALSRNMVLDVPNRGQLRILPGDWIAVDLNGGVILIPERCLPNTVTATGDTHTNTTLDNLSVNVFTLGWSVGLRIVDTTNAGIPAATRISAISADGKTITLSKAATATNAGGTMTVGDWTHS